MRPYFEDESVVIYHGDCREILPTLDPVDLVLTDPPYGVNHADWDVAWDPSWMNLIQANVPLVAVMSGVVNLPRCPERVGRLVYRWTLAAHTVQVSRGPFGASAWTPCVVYSVDPGWWTSLFDRWCADEGIPMVDLDTWAGTSDMSRWWRSGLPHRAAIPTPEQWVKLTRHISPPEYFGRVVAANISQASRDCIDLMGAAEVCAHPSPKPVDVTKYFLSRLPGRTVLDPFMGSGTTLRAAKDLGRKAIGIEIEERYCEIAAKRMAQGVLL